MKFLIIRFSSIGDIVLTTPVIRCLKKQLPDAEVHYVTKGEFTTILESNPYIDKLHVLSDLKTTIRELKQEGFDYIIDLHHNLRTLKIKMSMFNVLSYSFNKLNIEKWLLTNFKINVLPKKHIVDRYMETVTFFNIRNDGRGLDYFIPEKDVVQPSHLPATHVHGFITIAIGAAHNTKKLPLHKLKELCGLIDHPIMLLGGKQDRAIADEITSTDAIKIYNACGKFNLNESADLIRKSKLLITHDTGLMHIAAALQKPIISVWGNTVPQFGMYPYYGNNEIRHVKFEIQHLPCRPCSKIGYNRCPLTHFKCMELHSMNELSKTITGFLKKSDR
ncbi:MAG TPA: glycosyltransferase family 9 protein [Parafilimonas sp.]|nr:glycosyltransferase family 9 protein [Parafilimonas sp.]